MMFRLVFLCSMLCAPSAFGEDLRTDPLPMAHPVTGEQGLWIAVWLQQEMLKNEASLQSCTEERSILQQQATELRLSNTEARIASTELERGINALKTQLTVARTDAQDAQGVAQRRLYLTFGAAGAAIVAVSILLVEHL